VTDADFTPTNELETVLADAMNGRTQFTDFLAVLLRSTVYVSSGAEIHADGSGFQPLLFDREAGKLMAVFTARERVKSFKDKAPYCLTMTGQQLVERVPNDLGIVLNPGSAVGFELPAEGVQKIRQENR